MIHSPSTSPVLLSHIKTMKITTSFASAAEHSGIRGPTSAIAVADGTFNDSVVKANAKMNDEKSAAITHATKGLGDDTQETLFVNKDNFDKDFAQSSGQSYHLLTVESSQFSTCVDANSQEYSFVGENPGFIPDCAEWCLQHPTGLVAFNYIYKCMYVSL